MFIDDYQQTLRKIVIARIFREHLAELKSCLLEYYSGISLYPSTTLRSKLDSIYYRALNDLSEEDLGAAREEMDSKEERIRNMFSEKSVQNG